VIGYYGGEAISSTKHLSYSALELRKDKTFKLISSSTSLESTIPSTNIHELEGQFENERGQLVILPERERIIWLSYGKNPDSLSFSSAGSRRSAVIVIDTLYGEIQKLNEAKPLIFNLASKPNSKYIWNEKNCFIKFDNSEVSNDLTNYCSEIIMKGQNDQ
jgi:hypothetical protein